MLFRELPSELITFEQAAALAREEDPVQVARGLRYFAAMSGSQAEPRLLEEFERGLRHSDPGVRDAALQLASYNGWSEIRESVLLLKEKESHPEVLSRIDQVLAAYKKVEG
jgi:hypothetical protein